MVFNIFFGGGGGGNERCENGNLRVANPRNLISIPTVRRWVFIYDVVTLLPILRVYDFNLGRFARMLNTWARDEFLLLTFILIREKKRRVEKNNEREREKENKGTEEKEWESETHMERTKMRERERERTIKILIFVTCRPLNSGQ